MVAGSETPASLQLDLSAEAPAFGIDYYHLFFRDTRYTVAHTDRIKETQLTQDVQGGGETWMYVGSVEGFRAGDWVYIERTGTNEEMVFLLEVDQLQNRLQANVTITDPAGSYVTLRVEGYHIAEKFATLINDPTTGDIPGRYAPCQATVITAEGGALGVRVPVTTVVEACRSGIPSANWRLPVSWFHLETLNRSQPERRFLPEVEDFNGPEEREGWG